MKTSFLKFDPYRAMFPIGLFMGAWGVGSWLLYGFKLISIYPGTYHATLMIGGFLFLMAVGFLMTAIPAFTETPTASPLELAVIIALSAASIFAGIMNRPSSFHRLLFVEMLFLIVYGARRVARRKDDPPPSFIFVGFGILCGLLGVGIMCLEDIKPVSGSWSIFGHILFFQGMMLALVLGVGSRLLPALMGWEELPLEEKESEKKSVARPLFSGSMIFLFLMMFLLGLSFVLEAFFQFSAGRFLRAAVTSAVAFRYWTLFKIPAEKTWLSRWLWVSGWCVVLGLWGYALVPSYGVHLLHITFVGGFSLMTLMISSRVTLAHGEHGYELEESKTLMWSGILILAAMATRVLAPFTMGAYRSHLGYASLTWITAIFVWAWLFLKKIFVLSTTES